MPDPQLLFAPGLERAVSETPALARRARELSNDVHVTVVPKTVSGLPLQEAHGELEGSGLDRYRPDPGAIESAVVTLERWGLRVLRVGRFAISAAGPAPLLNELLHTDLAIVSRNRQPLRAGTAEYVERYARPEPTDLFVRPLIGNPSIRVAEPDIDHVVFTPPPVYFASSPDPFTPAYHHLQGDDIRSLLNVPASLDGDGIVAAVVDSGFGPHPYYTSRGLSLTAVDTPSAPAATVDDIGHGTAVTLNLFAVAPKVHVVGLKQSSPPQDAIEDAVAQGARLISCSWGWDHELVFPVLEATIRSVVRDDGVVVLFAAGNGHHAWPGTMPEVISVGGVYADEQRQLEASNYASGFISSYYQNRRVPDLSGLCGQRPAAVYIPMPIPEGCQMDVQLGGQAYPAGDETTTSDGWCAASGTSSATPQTAGVVALMLQRAQQTGRTLSPADVKSILEQTAVPVTRGRNAFGFPAAGHPNVAVGFGLVDAGAATAAV